MYDQHPEITLEIHGNAEALLDQVNALLAECKAGGWKPKINPSTGNMVSGQMNGGWRPSNTTVGSPGSSHKQGRGVDVADRDGSLDAMIDDDMLERHGLYRESPEKTVSWTHLTDRAPPSKRRTFMP